DGKAMFELYDTYGFPPDLTRIVAEENGCGVDEKGFHKEMEQQKQRARKAGKFVMGDEDINWITIAEGETTFVGYDQTETACRVLKYTIDDNNNTRLVLDKTPFYAEQGGQVADVGTISNPECRIVIVNVQKVHDDYVHLGVVEQGEINHNPMNAKINTEHRDKIAANHTATHLLHKALRQVLGDHVQQKGSLVHPDYLRFDFTHYRALTQRELEMVEDIVNRQSRACLPVKTKTMSVKAAKEAGATALFGEKYGDSVRVVSIGDFSMELCGGTHLQNTGGIALVKLMTETSSAAGIRRIEAITGVAVEKFVRDQQDRMSEILKLLNIQEHSLIERLNKLLDENKQLNRELDSTRLKAAGNHLEEMIASATDVDGVQVVSGKIKAANTGELRNIGDQLRNKMKSGIGVLAAEIKGKVSILTIVTDDLTHKYKAGEIVNKAAKMLGGKGGGRPDMAMAGGKETAKIDEVIAHIPEIIKKRKD
ncbi:MAG: alanine--tRNA ligase, partial [Candidatus Cloacimonetes bacterium]|nr:alanine--tRNA ligase [Candidatus Cloacimonadota bacterium]